MIDVCNLVFIPIKWKARTIEYKFYNEKYFQGKLEPSSISIKDYDIKLKIRNYDLINKYERLINFSYFVKLLPNLGEIGFDGECILESPDQNTIEFLIKNSDSFKMRIEYNIHKRAYSYAEKIAIEDRIMFLPSKIVLKDLRKEYSENIKKFNEKIEN